MNLTKTPQEIVIKKTDLGSNEFTHEILIRENHSASVTTYTLLGIIEKEKDAVRWAENVSRAMCARFTNEIVQEAI